MQLRRLTELHDHRGVDGWGWPRVRRVPGAASIVVLSLAVLAAAMVQGSVGIGFALVAAPVVTLVDTDLMPGMMIMLGSLLTVLTFVREVGHVRWSGLGWALGGRLPGTVLGVLIVASVADRVLGVAVGVAVLGAVVLTWSALRVRDRPSTLAGAGLVSGVTGTAVAIDGPPVAIVLQHLSGPELRATMSAYFIGGAVVSLAGLAIGGELRGAQAATAAALVPALIVGFALSGPLRRHVDAGRTRATVLVVCAVSAVVLLGRAVMG
jgi:uncharacterized membrane protein YfcA